MSDILSETMISIHEAATLLPGRRPGKKLNFSTIWRWIINGIRTGDGRIVRLEACRLGARWVTSREAIVRFSASLTPLTDASPKPIRTASARQRAAQRAGEALKQLGI